MSSSNTDDATHGHLYRVGKHWYLDAALLQVVSKQITVEPMQGGYQILAPAGLVRCAPTSSLALPGQSGQLYRCQGQIPEQDVGARLRELVGPHAADFMGGEWDEWPGGAATSAPVRSCCNSCSAGGPCAGQHVHGEDEAQPFLERLILSETLGTVVPRTLTSTAIALYPAQHRAPEWAAGRYHECIGSILQFPDVPACEWIVLLDSRRDTFVATWGVTLDRQRTLMLSEIMQLVARLADRTTRNGSVRPSAPSRQTPGAGAWELAFALAEDFHRAAPYGSLCARCPYRLGTNLRCPMCRQWQLGRKRMPASSQEAALVTLLSEPAELRSLPPKVLRAQAQAIAHSHANNPHEALTDRFFMHLERDVLRAQLPLRLGAREAEVVLEIAEMSPLEPQIAVGVAARKEAA